MCGRINVTDDPFVKTLSEVLGIKGLVPKPRRDIAPGGVIQIVREVDGVRMLEDAVWWLCLDPTSLKPNYKYTSFNSRSARLNDRGSLAYKPFRMSRCVIIASGFVEGLGDKKHYFYISPERGALAFGGVYKEWLNEDTGELILSTSIITLPPHDRLKQYHPKSTPLMLPANHNQEVVDRWLAPSQMDVSCFNALLRPNIPCDLAVTPIDRPSTRKPIAESHTVNADLVA